MTVKMIVGLGNPGDKYDGTKHNIGFEVVDALLKEQNLSMTDQKFRGDYTIWRHGGDRIIILKPFTYMNLSGEAVLPLMSYFGVGMEDLLVIYDDMDLAVGQLRLRQKGSAGGHNGMKSVIEMLGSQVFDRLKVGIGRPAPGWKVVDHVLAPFAKDDRPKMDDSVLKAVAIIEDWASGMDMVSLMNKYH